MILKGKVTKTEGWRAFVSITSVNKTEITPWCFELPLDRFPIIAGDEVELRISGKTNVTAAIADEVASEFPPYSAQY